MEKNCETCGCQDKQSYEIPCKICYEARLSGDNTYPKWRPKPTSASTVLTMEEAMAICRKKRTGSPCQIRMSCPQCDRTEQDAYTRHQIAEKLEAIRMNCPGTQLDELLITYIAKLKE